MRKLRQIECATKLRKPYTLQKIIICLPFFTGYHDMNMVFIQYLHGLLHVNRSEDLKI